MTAGMLRQALAYARSGWPVFPCQPGAKVPATAHGFRDATTDPVQITSWFGRGFGWNLAIATGAPGPDVLDIDQHGPAGNGYPAFTQLQQAGLVNGAAAYVRTPAGGMHAYFTGSHQHNGHLASHHLALTQDVSHLAHWVASQTEGNRNAGLFWAANRALDTDPAANLNPLAIAARQAGLDEPEITRTLDSARRTNQPRPHPSGHQAETES